MPVPGPGRVVWDGLQHSIATRDPNFDPRRETICLLLRGVSHCLSQAAIVEKHTECDRLPVLVDEARNSLVSIGSSSSRTGHRQLFIN